MGHRNLLPLITIVLLSALLAGLLLWQPATDNPMQPTASSLPSGGDFKLQSADGPIDSRDYRGQVIALYFGYTWCPDICPTNLSLLSSAINELTPEEQLQLQAFFISVDPERDDVARLKEYASYFNPRLIGITGSRQQVDEVAQRYAVAYRKTAPDERGNYAVDHSSRIYLLDKQGQLRKILEHATPASTILAEIQQLMR